MCGLGQGPRVRGPASHSRLVPSPHSAVSCIYTISRTSTHTWTTYLYIREQRIYIRVHTIHMYNMCWYAYTHFYACFQPPPTAVNSSDSIDSSDFVGNWTSWLNWAGAVRCSHPGGNGDSILISHTVSIQWFQKVSSPIKSSTFCVN